MVLAHGVTAKIPIGFDRVVEVLKTIDIASNVYYEVLDTEPRIAVFVGEKYFLRAGNYLSAVTIVVESPSATILRIIASGGRESFLDFFDWGSAKSYARKVLETIARKLGVEPVEVVEVNYLERKKSSRLWHWKER